ncbi:MAG: hypothetical protein ABSF29_06880 [Tepidisphaeraceae bacterium]|jgi:hypothetical protein
MGTSDLLICPDCGGLIGATETTDQGKPCVCFKQGSYKKAAAANAEEGAGGDTSVMGQVVARGKVCCQCGVDLTGKKRLRDSLGYWCVDCHRKDQAANAPKGVRCADCARVVPEAALTEYDGIRLCPKCLEDRKAAARRERKFGKVDDKHYQEEDRRRVIVFAIIFAILLLIIILQKLHVLKALF